MGAICTLLKDDTGLATVENAILVSIIVALAVAAWRSFASTISSMVQDAHDQWEAAASVAEQAPAD